MTWGKWGRQFSTNQMTSKIEDCLSLGVSTFDHADIYGGYTTEAEFGKAFAQSDIDRESIQLISKCGIQLVDDVRGNRVKHYQYDFDYIKTQAEQSISNLKSDYLDIFLLHRPSPLMNLEDIAEAITQLKSEGKIKHFGVSNFSLRQIELLAKLIPVEVNQLECSITHCNPFMDDTLLQYKSDNILPMAWSPLGKINTLKKENSTLDEILTTLESKYKCTRSQLAVAFLRKHPAGIVPVVGTTQYSRLKQLHEALSIELSLQDWFILLEASRESEVD